MTGRRIVHVFVSGRVQGVGYRDWTVVTATRLGIDGWVRNRRDGRVEAVLAGSAERVERMLEACRRGPAAARVDALETVAAGAETEATISPGFARLATA
jgi:acylphosphatase